MGRGRLDGVVFGIFFEVSFVLVFSDEFNGDISEGCGDEAF